MSVYVINGCIVQLLDEWGNENFSENLKMGRVKLNERKLTKKTPKKSGKTKTPIILISWKQTTTRNQKHKRSFSIISARYEAFTQIHHPPFHRTSRSAWILFSCFNVRQKYSTLRVDRNLLNLSLQTKWEVCNSSKKFGSFFKTAF